MNPYISRGPVRNSDLFYGRTHELDEIAAFLQGSQSVSIIGPRKIGKTSLLFHLMRPETWPRVRLGDDNLFVYLDCEVLGESTHDEIFAQFAGEMAAALEERGLPPEPALDAAIAAPTRLAFEGAVRKLNRRGLRVALILDEFERLSTNTRLDINFFNALRSAAGRYQLVFLTASARPLIELTYAEHGPSILSSPFFNIFAPLFLGLLPEEEARQLIDEPAQRAGSSFSAATAAFLYELVGGHPLALQVACFHACDVLASITETSQAHAEIERRVLRELQAHFEYYWQNLTPLEQEVLRNIADAASRAAEDTALRGALRDLVQRCMVVPDGADYRYPSRAWSGFVASRRPTLTNQSAAYQPTVAGITGGLLAGARLGAYDVLEQVGRGGMAEVYKGCHPLLERTVAIKVLPAALAVDPAFRQRFEREARAVAALRHPNIVQVFDYGEATGICYMVMEFVGGRDLGQYLRDSGPLDLDEARAIMADVAAALDYAHAQGLIHRDVKPSNVLLEPINGTEGCAHRAVLTDFGIARILSGQTGATQTGMMLGTLDYMAPEQINAAREIDGGVDIYALGVMLYQMLTGKLPFAAEHPGAVMLAHLNQPPPDPRALRPDLPAPVAHAIQRALAKQSAERFASAGEFVAALRLNEAAVEG